MTTYFLSRDSVEAAKKLLRSPADGSVINRKARAGAIDLLKEYNKKLGALIDLNRDSFSAISMCKEETEIDLLIKAKSYPLAGMNDYQRLEAYGWKLYYKGARWDYYFKLDSRGKRWSVAVPSTLHVDMIFSRDSVRLSPAMDRTF